MTRIAHVTDPHFGKADPVAIAALTAALRDLEPDLVVLGGDVTQRAKRRQFRQARAWLDALPFPWLAIPGNHDVPLHNLFARVFFPLGGFRRHICATRAPRFAAAGLRVLGLDSTRRKVVGRLKPERLEPIPWLVEGEPGDLRVLVTHHPLVRRPLEGAAAALAAAERAGAEVVLAGHHHQVHVLPAGERMLSVEGPSPSHRLEPVKGFFVLEATPAGLTVQLLEFDGTRFAPSGPPHHRARVRL